MLPFEESEESLTRFKRDMHSVIENCLNTSFAAMEQSLRKKVSQASVDSNLEKILMDVVASELERSTIPQIEQIMKTIQISMESRLRDVDERLSASQRGRNANLSLVESKLNDLESKLEKLSRLQSSPVPIHTIPAPTVAAAQNPYQGIEQMVNVGDWEAAFKRAVSVYNGMDFICHVLSNDKAVSAEDLFSKTPITDPMLALQMCVNLAQELVQSDKLAAFKLDIINELVLSITNIHGFNLTHHFSQLKTLLIQVQNLAGQASPLSSRVKEITKILVATERLLTPISSIANSPTPKRYFGQSPGY